MQGNEELAQKLRSSAFNVRVIPSVAYTNPEVAWVGLTEDQAKVKAQGIKVKRACFLRPRPVAPLPTAATKASPNCCLTIHPHPTLGESIGMAAEVAHGSCTDLPPQKK